MVVFKALNKSSKLDTIFKILESDLNVRSTLEKKKMLQNGETASRVEKQPLASEDLFSNEDICDNTLAILCVFPMFKLLC